MGYYADTTVSHDTQRRDANIGRAHAALKPQTVMPAFRWRLVKALQPFEGVLSACGDAYKAYRRCRVAFVL